MKKNHYLFIFLFSLLLISCSRKETGTLRIILNIEPLKGYNETTFKESLASRIQSLSKDLVIRSIDVKRKEALIEIDEIVNDSLIIQNIVYSLPQKGIGLQFYETYEGSEVYSLFGKLQDLFPKPNFDSLMDVLSKSKRESLEEKIAFINDSSDLANKRQVLFGGLFIPNFIHGSYSQEVVQGCVIGYCHPKDSASLFKIFEDGFTKKVFPEQLVFKSKRSDADSGLIEIYTLRLTPPKNIVAMEGDLIEKASVDLSNGYPCISMQFKVPYIETWQLLTRRSAPSMEDPNSRGKCIAILYDDNVLSAPIVNGEIPNGNSQISGNFDFNEAKILASKIKTYFTPCKVQLKHYEFIPDK